MRPNILKRPARELRQEYIQQYLKHFLRRVHPDLFQKYPKEQLRNSASLQDLLPLVNHEKQGLTDSRPGMSVESHVLGSKSAQLVFYYKPDKAATELKQVEHALPLPIDTRIPIDVQDASNQKLLEQEVKSWEMVQSFLELCRKVGVPVKEPDQKDVSIQLEQSIQEVNVKQPRQKTPHKPLGEIFAEELQGSFSGSLGSSSYPSPSGSGVDDVDTGAGDISSTHLGKIGGSAPALDAQVMIRSNPLLFQSPELSQSKLGRVVRTWIHWQEEDEQNIVVQERFRLNDWWRKVPLMIMSSTEERATALKGSQDNSTRGMLIVDADMSKHDMIEYLHNNLARVQREYRGLLQQAGQAVPPRRHSSAVSNGLSDEAASYLARMKARSSQRQPRK